MSANHRALALSAELARVGGEALKLAEAVDREPLTDAHVVLFGSPARALEAASEMVEAKLYEAELHGESPRPALVDHEDRAAA